MSSTPITDPADRAKTGLAELTRLDGIRLRQTATRYLLIGFALGVVAGAGALLIVLWFGAHQAAAAPAPATLQSAASVNVLGTVKSGTGGVRPESAAAMLGVDDPTITYTVTAKPGTPLTVAWTQPGVTYPVVHGQPVYPYRTVTVPASGTWTTTVPADGWLGGWDVPTLSALPAEGLMPRTDAPGFDCRIDQAGTSLARDHEPAEYFCLASTNPQVNR